MNTYCTFYIVRHGETEWNVAGKLQGHHDSPLTEAGIRQAMERSQTFQDLHFADAFSSDIFRAQRTAEIITADHQLVIKTSQLLRERRLGKYEGWEYQQFQDELRETLEKREALSEEEQFAHHLAPEIESDAEIAERMIQFLRETAVAYPGKKVLVVSHGGIIKATLQKIGALGNSHPSAARIQNLGYAVIDSDGVDFFVKELNGIS